MEKPENSDFLDKKTLKRILRKSKKGRPIYFGHICYGKIIKP
jgi:hypothetical protein